ncbi:protein hunchback [Chrysoperla carnea]|uniref:protein hunchback n=1 Tax=Chrysoperla carnea TaxID=189513 RepID=UPI001D097E29|nr:protein hunchback [Chrysoperla carnea]XP_044743934.1 protein hunchback [Chrysoperla carnea]
MRGGCFWMENMSSISCVQGNSGLIGGGGGISHLHTTTTATTGVTAAAAISPTFGGGSYSTEPLASVRPLITTATPQSPAQGWHSHPVTTIPSMKEEIIERDERIGNDSGISSAYTPGSDGFHSSSPEGSDHNSRDSEPVPIYSLNGTLDPSTPINFYNSTPVTNTGTNFPNNMQLYQHAYNNLHYDNTVSTNLMDTKIPLKSNNNNNIPDKHVESLHADIQSPVHSESDDSEQYYKHGDGDDSSLHRLEIAMGRNDLLSGNASPKGSEHNSLEDDKSDYEGEEDEASLSTPRVNSHGKVKIFKCKQCEFVAVTKLDFWEHTRSHIKVEKLLTCPKCPFVTEYKHHLEYHLRNHFGSKPFKCDKCNYSCVNKSMLNSHLKSHSNIYQYRCSDCAYATKYCHSLKLHLRKYNHKPAMVLNPDGSPNPLPIIDVYGTRRGPKQRGGSKGDDSNSQPPQSPPLNPPHQSPQQQTTTALQHSMFPTHFMFPPNQSPVTVPPHFSFGQLLTAFQGNIPNPLMFPQNNNNNDKPEMIMETTPSPIISAVEKPQTPPLFACKECEFTAESQNDLDTHKDENHIVPKEEIIDPDEEVPVNGALDLSSRPTDSDTADTVPPMPTTPTTTKNRRKGRAFKLGHVALQLQHATGSDDEDQSSKKQKINDSSEICDEELVTLEPEPATVTVNTAAPVEKKQEEEIKKDATFNCQYCDIVFKDVVMYTMHMGYHGWKDPFTCNMCGEETEDKVAFFLHIARTSHC